MRKMMLRPDESSAAICRRKRWKAADQLVGDEGRGPEVIELRYIGDRIVVAKTLSRDGVPVGDTGESFWCLSARDWKKVRHR